MQTSCQCLDKPIAYADCVYVRRTSTVWTSASAVFATAREFTEISRGCYLVQVVRKGVNCGTVKILEDRPAFAVDAGNLTIERRVFNLQVSSDPGTTHA